MKKYTVSWLIKANRMEWREGLDLIEAENTSEVKGIVKDMVQKKYGRHAFDIIVKACKEGMTWQAMMYEISINNWDKEADDSAERCLMELYEREIKWRDELVEKAISEGYTVNHNGKKWTVRK